MKAEMGRVFMNLRGDFGGVGHVNRPWWPYLWKLDNLRGYILLFTWSVIILIVLLIIDVMIVILPLLFGGDQNKIVNNIHFIGIASISICLFIVMRFATIYDECRSKALDDTMLTNIPLLCSYHSSRIVYVLLAICLLPVLLEGFWMGISL